MASISSQHFEPVLLDHRQQLERHAAGPLGAGLPLLYRGLAGVQIAREYRSSDMRPLADSLDLFRMDRRREVRHDSSNSRMVALSMVPARCMTLGCAVNRIEGVALEPGFTLHRIAPVSHPDSARPSTRRPSCGCRPAPVSLNQQAHDSILHLSRRHLHDSPAKTLRDTPTPAPDATPVMSSGHPSHSGPPRST